ncbi:hypothetical protein [Microtetraspora niveoalba]|uniref:hypothetical protein n=1 Tax=Microtetraspora niveoalba TaxID=46175 RepID=UPI000832F122|nr:hypothetical protein [Microtetraspora niveoalba]
MRTLTAVIILVAGVSAACATADPPRPTTAAPPSRSETPTSPSPAPSGSVRCADAISGEPAPPDGFEIIGGAVALPTNVVRTEALQAATAELPDGSRGSFAKQGLLVRRGHHVELTVPENLTGRAWMIWGLPGKPGARVVVGRCEAKDEWAVFAGGYLVRDTGCLPVRVRVDGGPVQEVTIGVGAPCPGQGPPPRP